MKPTSQSGYALFSFIAVLIGVAWAALAMNGKQASLLSSGLSVDDRHGLLDARQALLSYATIYPFLYGPGGAGPAHLPCPDSDGYRRNNSAAESGMNQNRDGPNPPCASFLSSTGLLPRHVKLPGNRYSFHSQPWQRYRYEVSGDVVNNPLNRVVNLSSLRNDERQFAAVVSLPLAEGRTSVANVRVSKNALVSTAASVVAAWIIERSSRRAEDICDSFPVDVQEHRLSPTSESDPFCLHAKQLKSHCENEFLLALVMDSPLVSDNCLVDNLKKNRVEAVPAARHWFIRNAWHSSVVFSYAEGCSPENAATLRCKLTYPSSSRRAIANGSLHIELHWSRPL